MELEDKHRRESETVSKRVADPRFGGNVCVSPDRFLVIMLRMFEGTDKRCLDSDVGPSLHPSPPKKNHTHRFHCFCEKLTLWDHRHEMKPSSLSLKSFTDSLLLFFFFLQDRNANREIGLSCVHEPVVTSVFFFWKRRTFQLLDLLLSIGGLCGCG